MIFKSPYLIGLSLSAFLWGDGLAATPPAPPANYLPDLAQRFLDELKKPEYGASRCMISPGLASDQMTVGVSVDRVFSAGDVIVAIGSDPVDAAAKTPVKDLLVKHGVDETVPIKIRRAGAELIVAAKCTDSKPFYDLELEGVFAASKNDAVTCVDKLNAAKQLHVMNFPPMFLAFQCAKIAGKIPNSGDQARGYYEAYRMMVLLNLWSSDALSRIRGDILTAVDALKKGNATLLADDLKQQYDQAVAAKSPPTSAPVSK